MLLLGIDTSSAVSVALVRNDQILAQRALFEPRRHAELLAPLIVEVLAEAGVTRREIDGIAVGTGPGPFTGLRVGLVTARTMALALQIPTYGVSSLDALALQARDAGISGPLIVITDARRREVYWARYAPGQTQPLAGPAVGPLADIPPVGHGEGEQGEATLPEAAFEAAPEAPPETRVGRDIPGAAPEPLDPHAQAVARLAAARLAAGITDLPTEPLYLRRPHVQKSTPRKRATV